MASKFKNSLLLLGQCMPSLKQNASKIRVRRLKMDENLNMVRKSHFSFLKIITLFHIFLVFQRRQHLLGSRSRESL